MDYRYGRWIAALLMLALLLAVVIIFSTVDLDTQSTSATDVNSAPILSSDGSAMQGDNGTDAHPDNSPQETPAN